MIGILAGMGPKSTGPFIDQVVHSFQLLNKAKEDMDFPPMMIYSLPTPFYLDRPLDHNLIEKTICEGLKQLESCGVEYIAMPCNSAHRYFQALKKCVQIPLLNMIDITLKLIPSSIKKVTVIGTRSTFESEIYQKELSCSNFTFVFNPHWQEKIDKIISTIKTSPDRFLSISLWDELCKELQKEDIEAVVLACSDLNGIIDQSSMSFQIIDSSLALARAVVHQFNTTR